ncbi:MAG: hypothetical protein SH850_11895 [Planctomycetaceae bacterium]|nr:hypothetical protein [Planctomycetaceae bacterium]
MMNVESWQEFALRNGGDGVEDRGRWLFPSGGMTDLPDRLRWEPPTDETKRLKNVRWYWQVRVEQAEAAFDSAKRSMMTSAQWNAMNAGPGVHEGHIAALKELKRNVTACRRELKKIERQLANTPEELARRLRDEMDALRRQQQSPILAELSAIEI